MPRRARLLALLALLALATLTAPGSARAAFGDQPVIANAQATDVTTTSATIKADVTFNEKAATWWLTYCRDSDCVNGVTTTPRQTIDIPDDTAAVTPQPIQWSLAGLAPSNLYRVTIHAQNDSWNDDDANPAKNAATQDLTFRTADPVIPPTPVATSVQTDAPTGVTASTVTFNGRVVPGTTGSTSDGASAFFEWGVGNGTLDRATPPQQLPSDAATYPISAAVSDLAAGTTVRYRLVAVRAGQRFEGQVQTVSTPSAPTCPAQTTFQTVRLQRVVAVGCFRQAGQRWVAESALRLNGLLLEPDGAARTSNNHRFTCDTAACGALQAYLNAGNKLYLDGAGNALGTTGAWRMSADGLPGMYDGTLRVDDVQWGGDDPLLTVGVDRSVDLIGFPLAGQATMTPSADGTSRLGLLVGLPVALGGVTGEAGVKVNPGGDLAFDRLRIEVGEVPIKGFSLGGLVFEYDRTLNLWHGAAELTLPTPTALTIGAEVTVQGGRFGSFSGSVDNLNVQIATGIFLQKVSATFGLDPIRLGGGVGISAGPTLAGVTVFRVDGSFLLNAQSRYDATRNETLPPSLQLGGSVSIFSIPVRQASAEFFFTKQAWIEMQGQVGIDVKAGDDYTLFSLGGQVEGALRGTAFEVGGTMGLTVLDFDVARATAVLNTKGVAACGKVLGGLFAIGGYETWSNHHGVVYYCDMDRLRSTLADAAVAAAGPRRLTLPAGAGDRALVRFVGRGGAPQVRLRGPGGRVIDTPDATHTTAAKAGAYLALRNPAADQTDVLIAHAGRGRWTYEALPGSPPVARVQAAGPLPAVRVAATVRRKGATARLRWRLKPIAGQVVTFSEAGRGAPPRVLARTRRARGTVSFRPVATLQRKRTIVALVEQDGRVRRRFTVARYTAPVLGHAGRVRHVRAVRRGGGVTVTWSAMDAARGFQVTVVGAAGQRVLHPTTRSRLTLHGAEALAARSVVIRAVGLDGHVAPAVRSRIVTARRHHTTR